jgi:AcrR family transcriptional regulator
MRQIVSAAGQANHYAVQHHFGDKSGLIRAILEQRLTAFDQACARALRRVERAGRVDTSGLVEALLMPIAQFVDERGRHTYAQFLLRLQQGDPSGSFAMEFHARMDANVKILALLRQNLSELPEPVFALRMRLTSILFLQGVVALDHPGALNGMTSSAFLAHVVSACVAVLAQPKSDAR